MTVVDLACRDVGTGLPLVLLHAFPLSSAMWLDQRAGLAGHCRVITPDQRGFGGSPLGADEPDLDRCVADLVALLDRLGLDRVLLGGLSMGGYVAMAFLRRHPDRVRALLLADSRASADPPAGRERREWIAQRVVREGGQVLVDEVLPPLLGTTTLADRPDVTARVRKAVATAPAEATAWAARAMARRPDSFDVLRAAAVPALVVVGEEDALTPPSDAEAMVAALPRATLRVLPGAGHLASIETPEAFNAAVLEFVADLLH
ncbi:MAG: hydrolase, alpha/beta fold family [Frankiales bacterium]|nr:hydrolase, alpha/beta fold family [Frankiales bacterium]